MESLAEFWIADHVVALYPEGFSIFHGCETEYTSYFALAEIVAVDGALLLLWKWMRPETSRLPLFLAALALGAVAMFAGVTTASRFSTLAGLLTAAGALLGVPGFGLCAILWRMSAARSTPTAGAGQRPAASTPRGSD